jgi:hypothetical protein
MVWIIVLKPAQWVDPELKPGRVEEKIGKEKIWCDPARPSQKPDCNSLTFTSLFY